MWVFSKKKQKNKTFENHVVHMEEQMARQQMMTPQEFSSKEKDCFDVFTSLCVQLIKSTHQEATNILLPAYCLFLLSFPVCLSPVFNK